MNMLIRNLKFLIQASENDHLILRKTGSTSENKCILADLPKGILRSKIEERKDPCSR